MSSLNPLEKEILKYEKRGFKKEQKKTLKYGSRIVLLKEGGFLGTDNVVYIYYVNGNVNTDSLREGFKDYEKYYTDNNFDSEDKGLFLCSGNCDEKLFRDLRQAMIRDGDIRNSIKLLSVNEPKKAASKKEQKIGKDSRRAFTQTQKNEILVQQDYKCAECHKKLDLRATEFDHKKPWASGGRTIVVNGRALCAGCHRIISHRHRLKQVDR